ncbi:PSP1 C-terminal conserved region-domain-containing protein [Chlamydoabsidia padenii]|nr:PSP1 C-terminal conserved region-domain-containing protein [Chlamydoabsidia padenii]
MIQQPEEYIDTSSQHQTRHTISPNSIFQDTGKGIPLPRLPHSIPLYAVEFKAGRMDYFYVASEPRIPGGQFQVGDLVIVEGDRGKDLGKVAIHNLTIDMVDQLITQKQQQDDIKHEHKPKDTYIKRLYRLATRNEIDLLVGKEHDEKMALEHCQRKTKMYQLPMIVVDAEYQWDRRKLTFFFVSNRRIDFRELVRELFKHYKARIWMCASNSNTTLPPHTLPS